MWGGTVAEVREMLARHGYRDEEVSFFAEVAERLRSDEGVRIAPEPIYQEFYLVEAEI